MLTLLLKPKARYVDWFGSSYYQKLYKNRSTEEARRFIDELLNYLQVNNSTRFVDICCGRGRHATYLAKRGYQVLGFDNAVQNIKAAKKAENDLLKFEVQDVLELPYENKFDVGLNLFTSFGYFDEDEEHQKAVDNFSKCLKPKGSLVVDFLNEQWVREHLKPADFFVFDGVEFDVKRSFDDLFIYKDILVKDGQERHAFREKVRRYKLKDFQIMFDEAGLEIKDVFGSYALRSFDELNSQRLILIAEKR